MRQPCPGSTTSPPATGSVAGPLGSGPPLRGLVKREDVVDVDLFPRDDDFFDQTLGNRLAIGKGETVEIFPQQVTKVIDMVDHCLPVEGLLLSGMVEAAARSRLHRRSWFWAQPIQPICRPLKVAGTSSFFPA